MGVIDNTAYCRQKIHLKNPLAQTGVTAHYVQTLKFIWNQLFQSVLVDLKTLSGGRMFP